MVVGIEVHGGVYIMLVNYISDGSTSGCGDGGSVRKCSERGRWYTGWYIGGA